MNARILYLIIAVVAGIALLTSYGKKEEKVLIFYKTQGFYHESIPAGRKAIAKICNDNGVAVDSSKNAEVFTTDNLKQYKAVIFLNTSGNILNEEQQAAFERYFKAGGGFVGVHAASDTEYDWPWYGKMVGAYFSNHPEQQEAFIKVVNHKHVSTKHLPDEWKRFDEWYNFKNINPDIKVLAYLDETSYKGGENGNKHPFSWYHKFDGGRAFYTAGGHREDNYSERLFMLHVWGGIRYVINKK